MHMREIEIKARCQDIKAVLQRLNERTIPVGETVMQHDQVFGLPGEKGDDINQAPWLRIRTEQKNGVATSVFTLKKTITSQLDSLEHETIVEDATEMKRIIEELGFEPYVTVYKTRRKAHIGDIELCIDEVEGLGVFVEAEKMTDEDADIAVVTKELWNVFERFGISRDDEVTDGYDVLIRKKEERV